jgi:pyruvate dehydrogenase E1 component
VFSITSFSELRREALECERWNLLHPAETAHVPYVRQLFSGRTGPVVAATDYIRTVPDQIRQWVAGRYVTLGTDGFGRSDSRAALRRHFEVDRNYIAVAALKALADDGQVDPATVARAITALGVDPGKPVPWKV